MQSMKQVTCRVFFFSLFLFEYNMEVRIICRDGLNARKYGNDLHRIILKEVIRIVAKKSNQPLPRTVQ